MTVETICVQVIVRCAIKDDDGNVIDEAQTDPQRPTVLYHPFDLASHLERVKTEIEKGLTPKG